MLDCIELACARNEHTLFSGLTFGLPSGTALQVRAANGVGKTTLLKTIAGLLTPHKGKILYKSESKQRLYLGHNCNYHPALTVIENLSFIFHLSQKPQANKLNNLQLSLALEFVNLDRHATRFTADLSAGQKQRLNLARLYLDIYYDEPKLWILDEPQINLDQAAVNLFAQLCAQHLAKTGAIIMATHMNFKTAQTLDLEQYV